jgi:voltage-gated potassium channel Kch
MTGPRSPTFDLAYPVPFRLERDAGPRRYLLTNRGRERLEGVTLSLLGAGVMPATAPSTLDIGESLEVVIAARDLARSTVLLVRWFRPSGGEYLWRVSF